MYTYLYGSLHHYAWCGSVWLKRVVFPMSRFKFFEASSAGQSNGYRKNLTIDKNSTHIDQEKVQAEYRFDGKWVLRTNTDLPAYQVALMMQEKGKNKD